MKNAFFSALLVPLMAVAAPAQAEWQPERPIEFVVGAGAGGGTDMFARTVQNIIEKHDLAEVPIIVTNKSGGGGAESFVYAKSDGDPHKLVFYTELAWYLPMMSRVGYEFEDFTPVAVLATDERVLWVNADSPYQTAGDLIEAAKKEPNSIRVGGTQPKGGDQILTKKIEVATGTTFRWIPFKGGSEVAVQLVGGHIDANMNNPGENLGHWQAGTMRPLCVFSPERLPAGEKVTEDKGWNDVPTCRESGVDVISRLYRSVFGAGLDEEQLAYYQDLLRKVQGTEEWQDYVSKARMTNVFIAGDELTELIEKDSADARAVFEREGWLVQ